jgi:predicted nucleic acid-binding Zn ribbon protein
MSTDIYKKCPKCSTPHTRNGAFCSISCANSRGPRTEDFKQKVRKKLCGAIRSEDTIQKIKQSRRKSDPSWGIYTPNYCIVCNTQISNQKRKTCSNICRNESIRRSALKQERHGGGHKGRYKGISCDSTYELAFLVWHLDHNIPIERSNNVYQYIYNGNNRFYIPDFVVNGQEIEIKGFMSNRAKAKLDQNPQVLLIDRHGIVPFINYVKSTYKIKDLRQLYDGVDYYNTSCNYCNQMFIKKYKHQRFCNRSCAAFSRHSY